MSLTISGPEYFLYDLEGIMKGNLEIAFNGQLINRGLDNCGMLISEKGIYLNLPQSNLSNEFPHNSRITNENSKTRLKAIAILNDKTLLMSILSINNQKFYQDLSGKYIGSFQLFEGTEKYKDIYSEMCSNGIVQPIPDNLLEHLPNENYLELHLKKR